MSNYAVNKQSTVVGNLTNAPQNLGGPVSSSVGHFVICNPNTTPVWVQFFFLDKANVSVGVTAPNLSIMCAANQSVPIPVPGGWWTHGNCSMAATTSWNGSGAPQYPVAVNFMYA